MPDDEQVPNGESPEEPTQEMPASTDAEPGVEHRTAAEPGESAPLTISVPRPGRVFAVSLLVVLLTVAAALGGFLVGQGSRKSDEQVAAERKQAVTTAVRSAVTVAVAHKGAEDKEKRLRIMHRAATRMNAKHRVEVRKLRKVASRQADNAYSSGSSAGRAAGYSDGVDDGITKASDDLSCSDDPDVPLPYCHGY